MKTKRKYNKINKTRRYFRGGELEGDVINGIRTKLATDLAENAINISTGERANQIIKTSEKTATGVINNAFNNASVASTSNTNTAAPVTAPTSNTVAPASATSNTVAPASTLNTNSAIANPANATVSTASATAPSTSTNVSETNDKTTQQTKPIKPLPNGTKVSHIYFLKDQTNPFIVDGIVNKGDIDKFLKEYGISSIPLEFLPDTSDKGIFEFLQQLLNWLTINQTDVNNSIIELDKYLELDNHKPSEYKEHVLFANQNSKFVEFLEFIQDFKQFLEKKKKEGKEGEGKEGEGKEGEEGEEKVNTIPENENEKQKLIKSIQTAMKEYFPEQKPALSSGGMEETKLQQLYEEYKNTDSVLQIAGKHFGILDENFKGTFETQKPPEPLKNPSSFSISNWTNNLKTDKSLSELYSKYNFSSEIKDAINKAISSGTDISNDIKAAINDAISASTGINKEIENAINDAISNTISADVEINKEITNAINDAISATINNVINNNADVGINKEIEDAINYNLSHPTSKQILESEDTFKSIHNSIYDYNNMLFDKLK